jgi:glutamine cyclotransferase
MIDGAIWANVWLTNRIAIIDPTDGHVRAWLDLASLNPKLVNPDAVLNGIAVDPVTRLPIVTGKLWSRMYVIRPEGPIPA